MYWFAHFLRFVFLKQYCSLHFGTGGAKHQDCRHLHSVGPWGGESWSRWGWGSWPRPLCCMENTWPRVGDRVGVSCGTGMLGIGQRQSQLRGSSQPSTDVADEGCAYILAQYRIPLGSLLWLRAKKDCVCWWEAFVTPLDGPGRPGVGLPSAVVLQRSR